MKSIGNYVRQSNKVLWLQATAHQPQEQQGTSCESVAGLPPKQLHQNTAVRRPLETAKTLTMIQASWSTVSLLWAAASSAQFCRLLKLKTFQMSACFQSGTSTLAITTLRLCNVVPGTKTSAIYLQILSWVRHTQSATQPLESLVCLLIMSSKSCYFQACQAGELLLKALMLCRPT